MVPGAFVEEGTSVVCLEPARRPGDPQHEKKDHNLLSSVIKDLPGKCGLLQLDTRTEEYMLQYASRSEFV